MSKTKKIVIVLILVPIVYAIVSIGSCEWRYRKYVNGFAQIAVGDDKEKVIKLLGEPLDIEKCPNIETCKDVFVYYSYIGRWTFDIDGNGKVIRSNHQPSP